MVVEGEDLATTPKEMSMWREPILQSDPGIAEEVDKCSDSTDPSHYVTQFVLTPQCKADISDFSLSLLQGYIFIFGDTYVSYPSTPLFLFPNLCRFSYIPTHAILPCLYATFDMLRNDWCAGGFPQLWFKKNKYYYLPGYYWSSFLEKYT
jgi:hypothetical protein